MNYSRIVSTVVAVTLLCLVGLAGQCQNAFRPMGDVQPFQQGFNAPFYGAGTGQYVAPGFNQMPSGQTMPPQLVQGQNQYAPPQYQPGPGNGYGSGGGSFGTGAPAASSGSNSGANSSWVDAFTTPENPAPSFRQAPTTVRVPQRPVEKEPAMMGGITQRDLQILGQHDVAVIVDRSLSMTTRDCPIVSASNGGWQAVLGGLLSSQMPGYGFGRHGGGGGLMSRWDFVLSQTMALARQTAQIFPHGITLVLFSSNYKIFPNVDMSQIPQIFAQNHPGGSTNTAEALSTQIYDYFQRRQMANGHVKPLVIAIVTDGMPSNPASLRNLIIETTRNMSNPHEIRITFLQIGTERRGFEQLNELDNYLVSEGARFDIVETKPFPEVVRAGLARSLVDAVEH